MEPGSEGNQRGAAGAMGVERVEIVVIVVNVVKGLLRGRRGNACLSERRGFLYGERASVPRKR